MSLLPKNTTLEIKRQKDLNYVISIKLPEDLIHSLTQNPSSAPGQSFSIRFGKNSNDHILMYGNQQWSFTKTPETQSADVVCRPYAHSSNLVVVGKVNERISTKSILGESKQKSIREKTEEAEKERLSRKSIVLDEKELHPSKRPRRDVRKPISSFSSIKSLQSTSATAKKKTMPYRGGEIFHPSSSHSSKANSVSHPLSPTISGSSPYLNSSTSLTPTSDPVHLKTKLMHLLALKSYSVLELTKILSLPSESIEEMIKEIGSKDSASQYGLFPKLYEEINIAGWPDYSPTDRQIALQKAKQAFDTIHLPNDHSARKYLKFLQDYLKNKSSGGSEEAAKKDMVELMKSLNSTESVETKKTSGQSNGPSTLLKSQAYNRLLGKKRPSSINDQNPVNNKIMKLKTAASSPEEIEMNGLKKEESCEVRHLNRPDSRGDSDSFDDLDTVGNHSEKVKNNSDSQVAGPCKSSIDENKFNEADLSSQFNDKFEKYQVLKKELVSTQKEFVALADKLNKAQERVLVEMLIDEIVEAYECKGQLYDQMDKEYKSLHEELLVLQRKISKIT